MEEPWTEDENSLSFTLEPQYSFTSFYHRASAMSQPMSQPMSMSQGGAAAFTQDPFQEGLPDLDDELDSVQNVELDSGAPVCEEDYFADPETLALAQNAEEAWLEEDILLHSCIDKNKKHLLQTHLLIVGLAGCELRESTKQMALKARDQDAYFLDAYRRWIDLYETMVCEPPADPKRT
jgi:hypothetical protein